MAEQLFRDGKKLMGEKKFAEACPMLAESQKLDPGGGTLLNLAACHEGEGKLATAWGEYAEALSEARRDSRANRVTAAQAKVTELEKKVPHLTVRMKESGGTVELDGVALSSISIGREIPVDPGTHSIAARASGKKKYAKQITIAVGEKSEVEIPTLEAEAVIETTPVKESTPVAVENTTPPPHDPGSWERPHSDGSGQRTAALIVGGVGLIALGVGTFMAVQALGDKSDSDQGCSFGCTQVAVDSYNNAKASANIATVAFGVGIVGVGVGTVLFLTAHSSRSSLASTKASVVPVLGRNVAGLSFQGGF